MDRLDFKSGIRRPDGFCCLFSKYRLEGPPACPRLKLSRLRTAKMPNQQIIQPEDFENWTKQELDSRLLCFYAEVRNTHGDMYKRTSLLSIRSSIATHLSKTSSIDITKDNEFNSSNDMLSSICKFKTPKR